MESLPEFKWKSKSDSEWLFWGAELIGRLTMDMTPGLVCLDSTPTQVNEGSFTISMNFKAQQDLPSAQIKVDFVTAYTGKWWLLPAVSYNGNHWGRGNEPKGLETAGVPWTFSFSRTSVPGGSYSEGSRWGVALWASAQPGDLPFSCSLSRQGQQMRHQIIWPEEEGPESYCGKDKYCPAFKTQLGFSADQEFSILVHLVVNRVHTPRLSYDRMLDFAWGLNYREQAPQFTPEKIWELGITYATRSLAAEEGVFRGFSKGLRWDGTKWFQRPTGKYLVGWTGQNLSLAVSLIENYKQSGTEADLTLGLDTLDTWVNHGRLDNGLIRCMFDPILTGADPARGIQDACNLADAAMNFFAAWELLNSLGIAKDTYLETGQGICDFALTHQEPTGRFGKSWHNDGTIADPEGTIGCYLVLPLLQANQITGKKQYLESALRGYEFYRQEFLATGFTTAAALDTNCVDKESAIPLLKTSLRLYSLTKHDQYIRHALQAAYYLATWQWHYTVPFPPDTTLGKLGYDTLGGTSVSTQHHHIDPFALVFVPEWFHLAALTGDDMWRQRAKAAWVNGAQGISDGSLVVNGAPRPAGSQDEGYFHTYWGAPHNVSNWLVAWPTAFRLEVLRRMPDWNLLK